jgi:hypothetical protein
MAIINRLVLMPVPADRAASERDCLINSRSR